VNDDRISVSIEAAQVVSWAAEALDAKLIDEAVGVAEKWPDPPRDPRAVAKALLVRSHGTLRPFDPPAPRTGRNGSHDSPKRAMAAT
jgi:hypothetical protein